MLDSTEKIGAFLNRIKRKNRFITLAIFLACLCSVFLPLFGFREFIEPREVYDTLFVKGEGTLYYVLYNIRIPRILLAILVGWSLGIAGAIFQHLLRNPLATPEILGISQGASFSVVLFTVFLENRFVNVPLIAAVGAISAALVIAFLADDERVRGYRIILVGIGISAMLASAVSFMLQRSSLSFSSEALQWLSGSLSSSTWDRFNLVAIPILALSVITLIINTKTKLLALGDDSAASLGLRPSVIRAVLLFLGTCLVAVAVAISGPIAFVALIAGPIARFLHQGRYQLLSAGFMGVLITLLADFIGSNLLENNNFPVGIVTGAIGAPFMLILLVMAYRKGA